MAKKDKTLEDSFAELNDIISKLDEENSLENSFQLYQNGIQLIKHCNDSIDKVEKQLIILGENDESDEL